VDRKTTVSPLPFSYILTIRVKAATLSSMANESNEKPAIKSGTETKPVPAEMMSANSLPAEIIPAQPEDKPDPAPAAPPTPATVIDTETDLLGDLEVNLDPPKEAPPAEQPLPGEQPAATEWNCPKCGKSFIYRSYLVRHINRSYGAEAAAIISALALNTQSPRPRTTQRKPDFSDITQSAATGGAVNYNQLAALTFDMSTGLLANIFGPEWMARADAPGATTSKERDHMCGAISRYMESKQMPDMPPGVILTICCVAYAAPRFQAPPTKTKIKLWLGWTWTKVTGFFKRKPRLKVT
jgi:hypothetical protein